MNKKRNILFILAVSLLCVNNSIGGSVVQLNSDGAIVVNGDRVFFRGAYRDPSDEVNVFDNLRNSGFNATHDYRFETTPDIKNSYDSTDINQWISDAQSYLVSAENAGLGVFLGLPRKVVDLQDNSSLTQIINSVKDYNSLWFWYLMDEPTLQQNEYINITVSDIQNAYNLIKSLDINHPVVITDGGSRIAAEPDFAQYCDLLWIDRYHVPYDVFELKRNLDLAKSLFPGKVIWAVAEAHDRQSYLQPSWVTNPYPARVELNNMNTYHNFDTLRAQAHSCISLSGVQGLAYYWGPDYWHDMLTETTVIWQGLRKVSNELKSIEKALLSEESSEGVIIEHFKWGLYERMNQLYGFQLDQSQYPEENHISYWIRKYDGSYYLGVSAAYVPVQLVTVNLPFEFARVVQYPDQKTIIRKIEGSKAAVYQGVADVAIWDVPNYKTISFILNDAKTAVWRIDPYDNLVDFSYSQDFTGSNGSVPDGWNVHDGVVQVISNVYQTAGGLELDSIVSTYDNEDAKKWSNYTLNCKVRKDYTLPTGINDSSGLFTGVCFRVVDPNNYYLTAVKKKAGIADPVLVLSSVVDGQVEDISESVLLGEFDSLWHNVVIEAYGSFLDVKLYNSAGSLIAQTNAVDETYPGGSVGIHADVKYPADGYYDDFTVYGEMLSENADCLRTIGIYGQRNTDLDGDCYIGINDLYIFSQQWLKCFAPDPAICN